ncbi:MAG TPA: FAD-binding protein [Polyangiaceae bacterium]
MVSRRRVLAAGAAVLVIGFDPVSRSWIRSAQAEPLDHLPDLDGFVALDAASLAQHSTDAGNIVTQTPVAVLFPGSVKDIQKMVKFCRKRGIKVAPRGQGHTMFGQSLVGGGLSIDMGTLNQIYSITSTSAEVDAGTTWKDLVTASSAMGFAPPVLTGFLGLSIGGTLSVGGISPTNNQGAQVDHVRELEVVTGEGELVRCSPRHQPELFEACLAGLGQCGIITRAVVDMAPVKPQVRVFLLNYVDSASFFSDLRELLDRGEFTDVSMLGFPNPAGGFIFQLSAVAYFDPAHPPDNAHLLRDLIFDPAAAQISDEAFLNYALRVDVLVDFLRSIGQWDGIIHPWYDVWLPGGQIEDYMGDVLPTLTPEDIGPSGFFLLFPQRRARFKTSLLRVPHQDEWIYLFDIFTASAAPGPDPAFATRMVTRNRNLFDMARARGGTRYPIGALQFSRFDWALHYGEEFGEFVNLKRRFDPDRILTPGPGIF